VRELRRPWRRALLLGLIFIGGRLTSRFRRMLRLILTVVPWLDSEFPHQLLEVSVLWLPAGSGGYAALQLWPTLRSLVGSGLGCRPDSDPCWTCSAF
jgi:hypothetical protein